MGLTTERKVFIGLMIVAGASLALDQTILSPNSASAAPLDTSILQADAPDSLLTSITSPITKSVTDILNERLSSTQINTNLSPEQSQDLQRMFAPLIKKSTAPSATDSLKTVSITPQPQTVIAQEPEHSIPTNLPNLSAVMPSRSGQSGAILDATLYRIGETTPQGYTLLKVEQRHVLVSYQNRNYWLVIPAFEE